MSLRVALLNSWRQSSTHGSGTAVAIRGLAEGFTRLGCRVQPLTPRTHAPFLPLTRLLYNLELPARLRGRQFDLIVGFDWDGCFFRPPDGLPYLVALKGVLGDERRFEKGAGRLLLWGQSVLEKANARRAKAVVTTSRYSAGAACRAYGLNRNRVATVPEGIRLTDWAQARNASPTPEKFTILSVAMQYRRKDTRTLLYAMPKVLERAPDTRLRIVGGGPLLPQLKRLCRQLGLSEQVTFLGPLPDDHEVRKEYARADLFCLPSRQEGFGIACLEAMASGLPVVAADAGAVPELVPDGRAGMLVPPGDADALATAIVTLLTDTGRRERMGRAGRARAAGFDWTETARKFLHAAGLKA